MVRWVIKEAKEQRGVHPVLQVVPGVLLVAPVDQAQSLAPVDLGDPVVCLLDHTGHHQVQGDTLANQVIGHQVLQAWDRVDHQEALQGDRVSECHMGTHRDLRGRIHRDIHLKGDSMVAGILHQAFLKVTQVVLLLLQHQGSKDMGPLLQHQHQQDFLDILPGAPSRVALVPPRLHHKQGGAHRGGNSQIVSSLALVQLLLPQAAHPPPPTPALQLPILHLLQP